jgi:hypothetical protein
MIEPRRFTADFDESPPRLQARGVDFPFMISRTDIEQFWFEPVAKVDEIRWQLELDWTCAGKHGTSVINRNGNPFEIYPTDALFEGDEESYLHSGCGMIGPHQPGCPALVLEALSPDAPHNTWGPVVPE